MRVGTVVTGGAVLVIRVVLRADVRILVAVFAMMLGLMDGGRDGRLVVNPAVPDRSRHGLRGGGAVRRAEHERDGPEEATSTVEGVQHHNPS